MTDTSLKSRLIGATISIIIILILVSLIGRKCQKSNDDPSTQGPVCAASEAVTKTFQTLGKLVSHWFVILIGLMGAVFAWAASKLGLEFNTGGADGKDSGKDGKHDKGGDDNNGGGGDDDGGNDDPVDPVESIRYVNSMSNHHDDDNKFRSKKSIIRLSNMGPHNII